MQINRISNSPIQRKQTPSANFKGLTAVHFIAPITENTADSARLKAYYKIMKQVGNLVKKGKGFTHRTVHSPDASIHTDSLINFPDSAKALEYQAITLLKKFQEEHPTNITITEKADPLKGISGIIQDMLDKSQNTKQKKVADPDSLKGYSFMIQDLLNVSRGTN